MRPDYRCGSYAGVGAHRVRGEEPCFDCKVAQSEYMQDYRKRNRDKQVAQERRQAARGRALRRLARQHPADFRQLYREELRKEQR